MNMTCLNKLAEFLIYAMIVDFSLELLDFIQRLYESEESIEILRQMIEGRLFMSLIITQIILGSLAPLAGLVTARFGRLPDEMRRMIYFNVTAFERSDKLSGSADTATVINLAATLIDCLLI